MANEKTIVIRYKLGAEVETVVDGKKKKERERIPDLTVVLRDLDARESIRADDLAGLISESLTRPIIIKAYAICSVRKMKIADGKFEAVDATTRAEFERFLDKLSRADLDTLATEYLKFTGEVAVNADP